MIERTEKEVEAKLAELWPQGPWPTHRKLTRSALWSKHTMSWELRLSGMYASPGLSFGQLHELAKFFGTLNIETESEIHEDGCETCDYGSVYGFVLGVREGDPP